MLSVFAASQSNCFFYSRENIAKLKKALGLV
jgi:hypothetical protein